MIRTFNRATTATAVAMVALVAGAGSWLAAGQAPPALGFKPELLIQLEVSSLDRAIDFYTRTLGFRLTERRDDLKFAHLETSVPGVEIGLGEVATPRPSHTVLNFSVADADAARRALEAVGVVFQGETLLIAGKVKLAGFLDPDGNRLRLAGPPK
jgi:catechol 2,3-dioxygenase-like lactoylglutathione lyase family enzyme